MCLDKKPPEQLHNDRMNLLEDQANDVRAQDARDIVQTTMKGIG